MEFHEAMGDLHVGDPHAHPTYQPIWIMGFCRVARRWSILGLLSLAKKAGAIFICLYQFSQGNCFHVVGKCVATLSRVDYKEPSSFRSLKAICIECVRVGASMRLHSTPTRRPFLNNSKSSSAPWCVAQ